MNASFVFLSFSLVAGMANVMAETLEDPADSAAILHDPFQKPAFLQPSFKLKTAEKKSSKSSWTPHLLMTLRAGRNSMANIGGQLIILGGKVNGYKLIKVYERSVVLVNQGKITRLTLDEENATDENF